MTIIIFLIVLAVLIFVHELGHFLAARWSGIRVDAFKIGFGPRILAWKSGETEYGMNLIPFGGFVRIHGENPDDESLNGDDRHRSFMNKNRLIQVIVLAAGVLGNFLFAWLLYVIVFSAGVTVSTDGFSQYADRFQDKRIMVTSVMPGSPAEKVGLKEGDTVAYVETTAMNATRAAKNGPKAVQTIAEIQNIIDNYAAAGDRPVAFEYIRDGKNLVVGVTPTSTIVAGKHAIGISMDNVAELRLPLGSAIKEGFNYTIILIRATVEGVWSLVANIFRGHADFSQVSGPVGIAGIVGSAARMGWTYLLMITAVISINLGVINLIPFPALDGGRILFVLIEAVIRRRIPHGFANAVNIVGFGLLMILMVAITWKDVAGLVAGK